MMDVLAWLDGDAKQFCLEVRRFIEDCLPEDLRATSDQYHRADKAAMLRWKQILHARGWAAPNWPKAFGGCGWSPIEQWTFRHESARARAPMMDMHGLNMVGPLVIAHGADAQKSDVLPKILNGDYWWCQGFSEPGAGSDLAALRTSAIRDGDGWRINGEKTWTTYAEVANMVFLLARSRKEGRPQDGLSMFLLPMSTPGVSVHPIIALDRHRRFNRLVLENVRVDDAALVGREGEGWRYARELLDRERIGASGSDVCRRYLSSCEHVLATLSSDTRSMHAPGYAALELRLRGLIALELRLLHEGEGGAAAASSLKVIGADLQKDIAAFALELAGGDAPLWCEDRQRVRGCFVDDAAERYLYSRAASIYGGSNEVQRNIIWRCF